jgi:predicted kinase
MGKKQRLFLIRGLPGTGKSTSAKALVAGGVADVHLETDQYFVGPDGVYKWDVAKIKEAHQWCFDSARKALAAGKNVVVSNVFSLASYLDPYIEAAMAVGAEIQVVHMVRKGQNVHNVPQATLDKMAAEFENLGGEWRSEGLKVQDGIVVNEWPNPGNEDEDEDTLKKKVICALILAALWVLVSGIFWLLTDHVLDSPYK